MFYSPHHKNWQGKLALDFGIGYFEGLPGDNQLHQHHAYQLSFSASQTTHIRLETADLCYEGQGFLIAANTAHRLQQQYCCSIYIDQTHILADLLIQYLQPTTAITVLPLELRTRLQDYFYQAVCYIDAFQQLLQHLQPSYQVRLSKRRLQQQHLLAQHPTATREQLAAELGLSPSRLSHWFYEQFSISLRSYRKWQRLIQGLQYMLQQQQNLTTTAHQVEFADQAHLSRTCKQIFGITPSALKHINGFQALPVLP